MLMLIATQRHLATKGPQSMRNNGRQEIPPDESKRRALSGRPIWLHNMLRVSVSRISKLLNAPVSHNPDYFTLNGQTTYLNGHGTLHCRRKILLGKSQLRF